MGGATVEANEVYDRQIRLWGAEAQKRMQESRVLFIRLNALQNEICKNIVLAGVNVALLDDQPVTPSDLVAQFFIHAEDVGKNRAEACLLAVQEMNPLAHVECHTTPVTQLTDDFLHKFDVICASDLPESEVVRLDRIARSGGRQFIYSETFGQSGFAALDLGQHVARPDTGKVKEVKYDYPALEEVFKARWSSLKDRFGVPKVFVLARLLQLFESIHGHRPSRLSAKFTADVEAFVNESRAALAEHGLPEDFVTDDQLRHVAATAKAELSPVCAVLGGILGSEVIKAISGKGIPTFNCFLWDGDVNEGRMVKVPV